jgi:hypothetical protein
MGNLTIAGVVPFVPNSFRLIVHGRCWALRFVWVRGRSRCARCNLPTSQLVVPYRRKFFQFRYNREISQTLDDALGQSSDPVLASSHELRASDLSNGRWISRRAGFHEGERRRWRWCEWWPLWECFFFNPRQMGCVYRRGVYQIGKGITSLIRYLLCSVFQKRIIRPVWRCIQVVCPFFLRQAILLILSLLNLHKSLVRDPIP